MSAGGGFGKFAVLMKERQFAIHHGVLFVIGFGLVGIVLPTFVVVDLEYLIGGLVAGLAVGSPVQGLISAFVGGSVMALLWLVLIGATGQLGAAIVAASLAFGNAVAGGLLGGLIASTFS